jgi:hypothetical protein
MLYRTNKLRTILKDSTLISCEFRFCKAIFILLTLQFLSLNAGAQSETSITLKDAYSGESVAFANVLFGDKQQGTVSNISGQFTIPNNQEFDKIRISCLRYKPAVVVIESLKRNQTLYLEPVNTELSQITVLPGDNPALYIIQNVVENRDWNNPDNTTPYSCIIYHKMTFALETPDSLNTNDDSHRKPYEFNRDNHFLLIESVSEKKHLPPNKTNERIISGRVSGFEEPALAILPTQLQPFTFYKEYIHLLKNDFLNPISPQGLRSYLFMLQDTLIEATGDTIFYISFEPRKSSNIRSLKGSLHIHQPTWGIKTVSASTIEDQSAFELSIRQNYTLLDGELWFPEQMETRLRIDRNITGQSYPFPFIGEGKSMVTAIRLNPEFSDKDFSPINLVDESANRNTQPLENWRFQPLTARDSVTYHMLDSLRKANQLDRIINLQRNIINGYLPMGLFNLNIKKLIDYNQYEGFKPGIGLQTSDYISRRFALEGFYSRSLKSRDNNYGGSFALKLNELKEQSWRISVEKSLYETGAFPFLDGYQPLSDERFRRFAVRTVDPARQFSTSFTSRIFARLKSEIHYSYSDLTPVLEYSYLLEPNGIVPHPFTNHEAGVRFKWQPLIRLAQSELGLTSIGGDAPSFWANFTTGHGQSNIPFEYYKAEAQLEENFRVTPLLTGSIRFSAGHLWGEHTPTHFYSAFGTYNYGVGLESRYTFATMRPNEFAASTFSLLFLRTTIPTRQNQPGSFKPHITLSSSAGWADVSGEYSNKIHTFDKGYYESGIYFGNLIKQLFVKYGVAVHYRYGPYRLDKEIDNWSFKIGLEIGL